MDFQHDYKKKYGQNFLNTDIFDSANEFLDHCDIHRESIVIEIGPGSGNLTIELVEIAKSVISIEVDSDLYPRLEQLEHLNQNLRIVKSDVLDIDFGEFLKQFEHEKDVLIMGSLPYNISKKIIDNILKCFPIFSNIRGCFLIQKEVAEDYAAVKPKATFLSSLTNVYAEPKYLHTIKKEKFYPIPKVDGGIISLKHSTKSTFHLIKNMDISIEKFIKFIKICYSHPRKTLFNNLKSYKLREGEFINLGFSTNVRPAELDNDDWLKLYGFIISR